MLRLSLMAALLGLAAIGCGPSNRPPTADEAADGLLLQVGDMYRMYQISHKRPPSKVADFDSARAVAGNAYEALKSGQIVVLYGATMVDLKEEPGPASSDVVLAYEKAVPESGGKVLLLDRHVKTMTAEEFKAAPKPSGPTSK